MVGPVCSNCTQEAEAGGLRQVHRHACMHTCMQAKYPFVQNNKLLKMKNRKTGSRPVWAVKQEPFLFGVNKLGKETR